jgi:hypothetical protein
VRKKVKAKRQRVMDIEITTEIRWGVFSSPYSQTHFTLWSWMKEGVKSPDGNIGCVW